MDKIVWLLVGGIAFLAIGFMGFQYGRSQCSKCADIDRIQILSDQIVGAQKIVAADSSSTVRFDWTLVSTWPNLARVMAKIGFKEKASGSLVYDTRMAFGYDLAQRGLWSLKREGNALVFDAPPLSLVECPAVLTQTLSYQIRDKSVFVDEMGRQQEVVRYATAQALAAAYEKLRAPKQIQIEAEKELSQLVGSLALPLGMTSNVRITHTHGEVQQIPASWKPSFDQAGVPDAETQHQLELAGCTKRI